MVMYCINGKYYIYYICIFLMPQLMQTSEGKFLNKFEYDLEELKKFMYIDKYNGLYRIKILYTIYIPNS